MSQLDEVYALLKQCSPEERSQVFKVLRRDHHIHPFEKTLNTTAEIILEAISKAPDLTVRGVRGIIAEAAFVVDVVAPLLSAGWRDTTTKKNGPYDCGIEDAIGSVRVQVKMQRRKDHRPMMANEGYRRLAPDLFVTETQRTRGGKDAAGAATRPYRFGEFDILAVSLHPSTNSWSDFMYTVASWLIADPKAPDRLLKFQPVSATKNSDWTPDFLESIQWFRSGQKKQIAGLRSP